VEGGLGSTRTIGKCRLLFHAVAAGPFNRWQGRGAFGSVVKARNKIDSRIYAGTDMYLPTNAHSDTFPVKKVRLRTPNTDNKILREINALSRLSHRFIVRYYTAWFEDSESASATLSSDGSGDDTADGVTSVLSGIHRRDGSSDPFSIDLDDLESESRSSTSFPSIHFTGSGSGATEGSDGDGDETDADDIREMFEAPRNGSAVINVVPRVLPPSRPRTLYIQMVSSFPSVSVRPNDCAGIRRAANAPRGKLTPQHTPSTALMGLPPQRIAEGLSEDEAWRLFQQIVDALVHMSSLGIVRGQFRYL
jgi:translation initiation factor 2-alpha kinase 4